MPKNWSPDWLLSARSFVVISKALEVKALLIEMSTLPIHAPSIRTCETGFPPPSTTAIFVGWPISYPLASAAATDATRSASQDHHFLLKVNCPIGQQVSCSNILAAFAGDDLRMIERRNERNAADHIADQRWQNIAA